MATSRTCPRCGRWHDVTMPCIAAATQTPGTSHLRAQADALENAAIERFRRRPRAA